MIRVGEEPLEQGVLQFLDNFADDNEELNYWPWAKNLFGCSRDSELDLRADDCEDALAAYTFRLLQWARCLFISRDDLDMFKLLPKGSAFHYWELVSSMPPIDGVPDFAEGSSCPAAILASAAFFKLGHLDSELKQKHRPSLISADKKHQDAWLQDGVGPHRCHIPIAEKDIEKIRAHFKIRESNEYTRTEP